MEKLSLVTSYFARAFLGIRRQIAPRRYIPPLSAGRQFRRSSSRRTALIEHAISMAYRSFSLEPFEPRLYLSGQPDLLVTQVSYAPTVAYASEHLVFSAVVKNQGDTATPAGAPVTVQFQMDGSTVVNTATLSSGDIEPGATVTLTADSGGPNGSNYWIATAGSHTLTATVNPSQSITEDDYSNNALDQTLSVATVPPGWSDADIGSPSLAGSGSFDGTTWTLQGSGADIWGSSDQFHFDYQNLTGDGAIIAQVDSQTNTNGSAKAGVMVRASTSPSSAFADVVTTPTHGVNFQWRTASGTLGSVTVNPPAGPVWVKLATTANQVTAFYSTNGSTWTQIGTAQTIATNSNALTPLVGDSPNPWNRYWLSRAFLGLGNLAAARKHIDEALADPDPEGRVSTRPYEHR